MGRFLNILIIFGCIVVLVPARREIERAQEFVETPRAKIGPPNFRDCCPKCPECLKCPKCPEFPKCPVSQEPCTEIVALEQFQLDEIESAQEFVATLRANRSMMYSNTVPIVTSFTENQKAQMRGIFSPFFSKDAQTPSEDGILFKEVNPDVPRRQKRDGGTDPIDRVCPIDPVVNSLVTACYANGDSIQVVQVDGLNQRTMRQPCKDHHSPLVNGVACCTTRRPAYVVGINVDSNNKPKNIQVHEVHVESCTCAMECHYPE